MSYSNFLMRIMIVFRLPAGPILSITAMSMASYTALIIYPRFLRSIATIHGKEGVSSIEHWDRRSAFNFLSFSLVSAMPTIVAEFGTSSSIAFEGTSVGVKNTRLIISS